MSKELWAEAKEWLRYYGKVMFYAVAGTDSERSMRRFHLKLDPASIERIRRKGYALALERAGLRLWRTVIVFGLAGLPIGFLLSVPDWDRDGIVSLNLVLGACLVFVEFFLLVALLFVRARVANINGELQLLEYERVLNSFERDPEKRAASLFFKHQAELKQYYDQTLRQNKQSFVLGITCIGFGLAAVAVIATLLLVHPESSTAATLAAGGLGILSTLLTGFVARLYLQIHAGSAKALGSFHDRLVNTNNYHFASLLISMIEPDYQRMEALSELARAIATPRVATEAED
jgi:hypothetical protein